MKPGTKKDVAARLRSIAGHQKAVLILGSHLETCVADAFRFSEIFNTART